jgi:hypothetical protein
MADTPQYVNPWDEVVRRETERLREAQTAPMPPMFSPDEVILRRALSERNMDIGRLGALSPDKNIHALGGELLKEAIAAQRERVTDHGILEPLGGSLKVFPEYQRNVEETRAQRAKDAAEAQQARASQANMLREQQAAVMDPFRRATAELQQVTADVKRRELEQGKPLSSDEEKTIRQASRDLSDVNFVNQKFQKYQTPWQGISFVGDLQDMISRAGKGNEYIPKEWKEQQDIWSSLQRIIEIKERKKEFGATLSPNEKKSWEQVTPPRGSTPEQMQQWIGEQSALIRKAIQKEIDAAIAAGKNPRQIEGLIGDPSMYRAPQPQPLPSLFQNAPTNPQIIPQGGGGGSGFRFVPGVGIVPNG